MGFQSKIVPEEILRVEEVTVQFGAFKALNELNFSMERGELRVVIGPNGAGKTTLLDLVTGKVQPSRGRVVFQPNDRPPFEIHRLPQQRIACLGIGRKFQTPNVFRRLTVLENLLLSKRAPRGVLRTLVSPFRHNGSAARASAKTGTGLLNQESCPRFSCDEILTTIGLTAKAHRLAGLLSHGEKQWLELGMLLAQDPELLLVDEPVAGMTPKESERTGELLLSMARKHTLLVIDHDMAFVRQIARKVTVLHEGKILCQGTVQQVQRDRRVIEVYLGQDRDADTAHRQLAGSLR
jgi:urea transport system ATP-binding protein